MNELDDLRTYVEVIRSEALSTAARSLAVSKSIVSRRIARLEADLGARLLDRTTRGVQPTEVGSEFYLRAERILAEYDEALEAVAKRGGAVTGRLRLTAPVSFGMRHVAPILARMAVENPGLEVDVTYSDQFVDLVEERMDAAVRMGFLPESNLVARRLASFRMMVLASPAYLAEHGTPTRPADLAGHECLQFVSTRGRDWQFVENGRTVSIRTTGRLRSNNGDALLVWASEGLGIVAAPSFLAADAVESGRLVPLLEDFALGDLGIYVVRPPGPYVPAKVRLLIDEMVSAFAGPPIWDRCLMKARSLEPGAAPA